MEGSLQDVSVLLPLLTHPLAVWVFLSSFSKRSVPLPGWSSTKTARPPFIPIRVTGPVLSHLIWGAIKYSHEEQESNIGACILAMPLTFWEALDKLLNP